MKIVMIAFLSLVVMSLFSFNTSNENNRRDEIETNTIKNDLADILDAIKSNDFEQFYRFFPNVEILNDLYINSKYENREAFDNRYAVHLEGDRLDFFKLLKSKFDGSSQDWMKVEPRIGYVHEKQVTTGIEQQIVGIIFESNETCYSLELVLVRHKEERYFFVKEPIDKTQHDCESIVNALEGGDTDGIEIILY